jgi:predicted dithiol-disulfide oxidoreductase (DUF899 family)
MVGFETAKSWLTSPTVAGPRLRRSTISRRSGCARAWRFPWVSSLGSDFKYDFGAAFTEEQQRSGAEYNFRHVDQPPPQREGMSAFALEGGTVYHSYSTYDRGVEQLMGTYRMLDLAPLGRNEEGPASWWHRHDEYEAAV